MTFALLPIAVTAETLLREIRKGGHASLNALADAAGRSGKHITRDIGVLVDFGLVSRPAGGPPSLTEFGDAQLAALDRAAGEPGSQGVAGPVVFHRQIFVGDLNPRRDFDSEEAQEELDQLRQDILQNGLLQNLVVKPDPAGGVTDDGLPLYELIAGERRFRAIGLARHDDDWKADQPVPVRIVDADEERHRLLALAENLQRRRLNPIEEAQAFQWFVETLGMRTEDLADKVSVTQRQVQMRLQLLKLSESDQERLTLAKDDPERLTIREARELLQDKKPAAAAPGEPELEPADKLLLAEILDHTLRNPAEGRFQQAEIQPDYDREAVERFPTSWLSAFGPDHRTGRFYIQLGYSGRQRVVKALHALGHRDSHKTVAPEILDTLRDEAGRSRREGSYSADWLNGPFVLSKDGKAIVAQTKKAAAEQAKAEAEQAAERERQAAATEAANAVARELEAEARVPGYEGLSRDVTAALRATHPLPYRWSTEENGMVDANGRPLPRTEAHARLVALLINSAADPAVLVLGPEEEPRHAREAEDEAALLALTGRMIARRRETRHRLQRWSEIPKEELAAQLCERLREGKLLPVTLLTAFLYERLGPEQADALVAKTMVALLPTSIDDAPASVRQLAEAAERARSVLHQVEKHQGSADVPAPKRDDVHDAARELLRGLQAVAPFLEPAGDE